MTEERPRPGQPAMERFVKNEVSRKYATRKYFLATHGITESTFYRVLQDSPAIGEDQYRRLEGALDLPRNVLDYIADMDRKRIKSSGLDKDQVRVILDYLDEVQMDAALPQFDAEESAAESKQRFRNARGS